MNVQPLQKKFFYISGTLHLEEEEGIRSAMLTLNDLYRELKKWFPENPFKIEFYLIYRIQRVLPNNLLDDSEIRQNDITESFSIFVALKNKYSRIRLDLKLKGYLINVNICNPDLFVALVEFAKTLQTHNVKANFNLSNEERLGYIRYKLGCGKANRGKTKEKKHSKPSNAIGQGTNRRCREQTKIENDRELSLELDNDPPHCEGFIGLLTSQTEGVGTNKKLKVSHHQLTSVMVLPKQSVNKKSTTALFERTQEVNDLKQKSLSQIEEIDNTRQIILEKDAEIDRLKMQLAAENKSKESRNNKFEALTKEMKELKEKNLSQSEETKQTILEKDAEIDRLKMQLVEENKAKENRNREFEALRKEVKDLKEKNLSQSEETRQNTLEKGAEIDRLKMQLAEENKSKENRNKEFEALTKEVKGLKEKNFSQSEETRLTILEKDAEIDRLKMQLVEENKAKENRNREFEALRKEVKDLKEKSLSQSEETRQNTLEKGAEIDRLKKQLGEENKAKESRNKEFEALTKEVKGLKEKNLSQSEETRLTILEKDAEIDRLKMQLVEENKAKENRNREFEALRKEVKDLKEESLSQSEETRQTILERGAEIDRLKKQLGEEIKAKMSRNKEFEALTKEMKGLKEKSLSQSEETRQTILEKVVEIDRRTQILQGSSKKNPLIFRIQKENNITFHASTLKLTESQQVTSNQPEKTPVVITKSCASSLGTKYINKLPPDAKTNLSQEDILNVLVQIEQDERENVNMQGDDLKQDIANKQDEYKGMQTRGASVRARIH